jgi:hypothetical protein
MASTQNEVQCLIWFVKCKFTELTTIYVVHIKSVTAKITRQPQTSEEDTDCTVKVATPCTFTNAMVTRYCNFQDIRTLYLMCILVYLATLWTNSILQYVTSPSTLFFLLHILLRFHCYITQITHKFLKREDTNIFILLIIIFTTLLPVDKTVKCNRPLNFLLREIVGSSSARYCNFNYIWVLYCSVHSTTTTSPNALHKQP